MGAAAHQLAGADGEESTTAEKMPTGTAASSSAGQPGGEGDGNGDEQQRLAACSIWSGEETETAQVYSYIVCTFSPGL